MNANDEAMVYHDSRDRFDRAMSESIAISKGLEHLDSKGLRELVRNLEGALREARVMERQARRMDVGCGRMGRVPE